VKRQRPVLGTDGTRVPLLRPGFPSQGTYRVSFVTSRRPAVRTKGDLRVTLPKMDVPVGTVYWEVFVPTTTPCGRQAATSSTSGHSSACSPQVAKEGVGYGIGSGTAVGTGGVGGVASGVAETVTVTGETPHADASAEAQRKVEPSQNVINLAPRRRRVARSRRCTEGRHLTQFVKPGWSWTRKRWWRFGTKRDRSANRNVVRALPRQRIGSNLELDHLAFFWALPALGCAQTKCVP